MSASPTASGMATASSSSTEPHGVFVVGASCIFPSGPTLPLAHAALRAPMALFRKHPYWADRCGQRPTVSCFPSDGGSQRSNDKSPANQFNASRWADLARSALRELAVTLQAQQYPSAGQSAPIDCAIWLVLPEASTPGVPSDVLQAIVQAVQAPDLASYWRWQASGTLVRGGHAAGVLALQQAHAEVMSKPGKLAVVLAVDCPLNAAHLSWLEDHGLLHGANQVHQVKLRPNPYGRIPGEGAAAVALTGLPICQVQTSSVDQEAHEASAGTPRTWSARLLDEVKQAAANDASHPYRPWAQILGVGTAQEPVTWTVTQTQSKPCLARGLTQAVFHALSQANEIARTAASAILVPEITRISTDLNGEPYRGDELGFTVLRLAQQQASHRALHDEWVRDTPALASGDIGSASAIAHTALAAFSMRPGSPDHRFRGIESPGCHLVLSSSDDPLRGAVLLGPLPNRANKAFVHPPVSSA
jgi:3-oxoacyl-[acyl-carrier-protein] synthase I